MKINVSSIREYLKRKYPKMYGKLRTNNGSKGDSMGKHKESGELRWRCVSPIRKEKDGEGEK